MGRNCFFLSVGKTSCHYLLVRPTSILKIPVILHWQLQQPLDGLQSLSPEALSRAAVLFTGAVGKPGLPPFCSRTFTDTAGGCIPTLNTGSSLAPLPESGEVPAVIIQHRQNCQTVCFCVIILCQRLTRCSTVLLPWSFLPASRVLAAAD